MKLRRRFLGWLILIVGLSAASCGGDDDPSAPPGTDFDAGSDGPPSGQDAGREAAPDGSMVEPGNDASIDAGAVAPDTIAPDTIAPDTTAPTDAPPLDAPVPDASDVATVDGISPDEASFDGGSDGDDGRTLVPPTDADAAPPVADADAASSPDGGDAGADALPEAGSETGGNVEAAADVASERLPDVVEEPSIDASPTDDADDAAEVLPESGDDAEGSTQELVRWQIQATPPECSTNPSNVACTDGPVFQVRVQANCPTVLSEAFVWFPAGAPPAVGSHVVLPVANIGQAFGVTDNQVAIEITHLGAPVERWWAQSGTVDVELDGTRRIIRFSGVTAFLQSNHATTTTLDAFLICGP